MPVHILQFFSTLNNGGAENRMIDVYRCIDPSVVTFDFAVVHEGNHFFDEEVFGRNSRKYVLPDPRAGLFKNYRAMVHFFRDHPEFKAVHAHVAWYNGVVLMAAKKAGVPVRIAHARDSARPGRPWKDNILSDIGKFLIARSATRKIAISEEAAENIFGKRAVKKHDFLFVPNSIDQKKYKILLPEDKAAVRQQLGVAENEKAYVTVANLRSQKNHFFLLKIAAALRDKGHAFKLFLIGDGDLRVPIEKEISALGLTDTVILLGVRNDVPDILNAFDGMIFPSFFEGLGGVVLEAQLVGVPAVVSDRIPKVADVGIDMVEYISLDESPEYWADAVIRKVDGFAWDREKTLAAFAEKGYIIEKTAERYLSEYGVDPATARKALNSKSNS